MKATWFDTFKDWFSLIITTLILIIPISIYGVISIHHQQTKKYSDILSVTSNVLSDFEITMDHLNGALINLSTSYRVCDNHIQNYMHQLSFDIPGVEAYAIVSQDNTVECSDWLEPTQLASQIPNRRSGLNMTGEEYIKNVGKTGVYFYRPRKNGGSVVALMSSTFLRQILTLNIPSNDTLIIYNLDRKTHITKNGLLASNALNIINDHLLNRKPTVYKKESNIHIQISEQYPNVAAVYLSEPITVNESFHNQRLALGLVFILSLLASWGWLTFRYQKVNSIEFQIKKGLREQEFAPYLQPIIDMRTGRWVGAESLARWLRNGKEISLPDEFIPSSEKSGDIKAITQQVSDKLCQFIDEFFRPDDPFYFSINLSPNFMDDDTAHIILSFEEKYNCISSKNIRFEITEHGIFETNKKKFSRIVSALQDKGYLFGLDDFGTGQSGLEYFSKISPNFLKIDRRFVNAISKTESVDYQLLKTIVQLAKSLKLTIIAEGVETEEERKWLIENDIIYGQGWLYQKAVPLMEFKNSLDNFKTNSLKS